MESTWLGCATSLSAKNIMTILIETLLKPFSLNRVFPQNYHEGDLEYFQNEFVRECSGVTAVHCESPLVDIHKGVVIDRWKVRPESLVAPSLIPQYGLPYVLRTILKSRSQLIGGPYLLIHTSYCEGYGHWMSDAIPRLYVMRERLTDHKLLLPSNYRHAFYIDSLEPFGITDPKQIEYVDAARLRVDRLAFSSHVGPSFCNVKDEVLQEIRQLYYDYFGLAKTPPKRRIYVSRANVSRRFVKNEDEVVSVLKPFGFEVVHFQEMSFHEQLELASQSEMMVGLTGSGLNNMMFMQPGAKVLEFKMRNDYHNLHYFGFASGLKLPYYYMICDTVGDMRFKLIL